LEYQDRTTSKVDLEHVFCIPDHYLKPRSNLEI
jgi:hypothetical protein